MGMEEEEKEEEKDEDEAKEDKEEDTDKVVEHIFAPLESILLLRAEGCRTHHPPKPSPGSACACSPTPFLADVILKP